MNSADPDNVSASANAVDNDTDSARLERHRALHRTVHPQIAVKARRAGLTSLALADAQTQLKTAIGHLHNILNRRCTAMEMYAAETAARDWLDSIGSEAT